MVLERGVGSPGMKPVSCLSRPLSLSWAGSAGGRGRGLGVGSLPERRTALFQTGADRTHRQQ